MNIKAKQKSGLRQRIKNFMSEEGTYGAAPPSARRVIREQRDEIKKVRAVMRGKLQSNSNGHRVKYKG